jgi:hypothetical protein
MAEERSVFRHSAIIGYELAVRPVRLLGLRGPRFDKSGRHLAERAFEAGQKSRRIDGVRASRRAPASPEALLSMT